MTKTLRDEFAMAAMVFMFKFTGSKTACAKDSYKMADAMLKEKKEYDKADAKLKEQVIKVGDVITLTRPWAGERRKYNVLSITPDGMFIRSIGGNYSNGFWSCNVEGKWSIVK